MKKKERPLIIFILGPTGVGKSDFAIRLAKKIKGEIISCDSMQAYKGMAIISQQPPPEARDIIPHHLVGILSPSKEWSAANFAENAYRLVEDIIQRRRVPLIVGGTGLYARAFIKGLFPSPAKDGRLRKKLYKEATAKGRKKIYNKLLKVDPSYASRIHPNDLRRIIRALEVYELTGKPISEHHASTKGIEDRYKTLIFVLNRKRKELYKRIDERVEEMFNRGVVEEVKRLRRQKISQTAKAALGYDEIDDYIKGKSNLERTKELVKRNTRHYAKRQLTWFRKEQNARWLELGAVKRNEVLINTIAKKVRRASR
jgi:tRNA dimethylallyltransferase